MKQRHVCIIGGGASGLVAAISAAREGAKVTVFEQKDRVGKKILATGNGRCNLTNLHMEPDCFRGDDLSIVEQTLVQFGYTDTVEFFQELGVILKDRQGYVYPISDQASTILDVLRMEAERLNIQILTEHKTIGLKALQAGFQLSTNHGQFMSDAVILATGGKAAPALGSDGSGYTLAEMMGHHISPVVPALVQLRGKGNFFKQVSGVRTQARVALYIDGCEVASDTGELQLTDYGISGIPVFQVSRFAAKALYERKKVIAEIDFLPSMDEATFQTFIRERLAVHGTKTAEAFLIGVFHKKLIGMLLKMADIPFTITANTIKEEKLHRLITLCKHFKVEIEATNGFEQAQVCAGGVLTSEISDRTFESKFTKDLYIIGELLDVDGICGGYNLQWAWSSGYLAGKYAAKGNRI